MHACPSRGGGQGQWHHSWGKAGAGGLGAQPWSGLTAAGIEHAADTETKLSPEMCSILPFWSMSTQLQLYESLLQNSDFCRNEMHRYRSGLSKQVGDT